MKPQSTINILMFFILLLTTTIESNAQSTFKSTLSGSYPLNKIALENDSNYIIIDNNWGYYKYTKNGLLTSFRVLNYIGASGKNFIKQNSGNYTFIGNIYDGLANDNLCIFSFNFSSNTINWQKSYSSFFLDATQLYPGQNNTMLVSSRSPFPSFHPKFFHADSLGNIIESFEFDSIKGNANCVLETSDNSFIANVNTDTIGAVICKLDTVGNIFWAKSYFRPKAAIHSSVQNSDGTITLLGTPDTVSSWQDGGYYHTAPLFLMNIDTSGNVLWSKSYGDTNYSFTNLPITQMKASSDGGYLICATIQNKATVDNDLIIIKTDANGDTLWTRTHGSNYSDEFGNDISETSDSGYIVAGYTNSTFQFSNGAYYIIKTDSLGMTATHCEEFNTPFAVNNITPNDSNVILSIITGVVTQGSSSVSDTLLPLPATADGCVLNSINQHHGSYLDKSLSYPNPTQGQFKIKTGSTNAYMVTVTVYDTKGVQLFVKQYRNADDVKLDLTGYGKGVYSIRITDNKTTRWSKVVVE